MDLLDRSSFAVTIDLFEYFLAGIHVGGAISTGDCADDRRKNRTNGHWFFSREKRIEQSSSGGLVVRKSYIGYPNAFAKTRRNAFRLKFRTASGGTLNLS
jgi:hypothetical protein